MCPAINNLCCESPSHACSSCQRDLPVPYTVLLGASIFVIASPISYFLGLPCSPLPSEFHSWHNQLSFIVVFSKSSHLRCLNRQISFQSTSVSRNLWLNIQTCGYLFNRDRKPLNTHQSLVYLWVCVSRSFLQALILPQESSNSPQTYCTCCVAFALDMIWLLSGAVCLPCRNWWLQ